LAAWHPDQQDPGAGASGRDRALSLGLRAALMGRDLLERGDQLLALAAPRDRPGLVVFVMHCVFADRAEVESDLVDPHERATPEGLASLIDHFRGHGYRFVSAADIDGGLTPGGRYAHLTFDDGFANNLRLLDLLQREGAFATVFPSINHVREGRGYWWNVLYRERLRRGQLRTMATETASLRRMTDAEVDAYLISEFGPEALKPVGDVDRPLTVAELRQMSRSSWIEIGNHTLDHAVLPNYPAAEAEAQVSGAQEWLERELGTAPFFIAYPNGSLDDSVVQMSRRLGLRVGVTLAPGRNPLPSSPDELMRLGRFRIVFDRRAQQRMRAVRSSAQLTALARRLAVRGGT
jgi:Predicted xylanase/chitin deacetylase